MTHNANHATSGYLGVPPKNSALSGSAGDVSSMSKSELSKKNSNATGFTSFNRFSTFVKSGGESFVLGKLHADVQETDIIQVVVSKKCINYLGIVESLENNFLSVNCINWINWVNFIEVHNFM